MIGEAELVVARKRQEILAVDLDVNALRRLQNPAVTEQSASLQNFQFLSETSTWF
jgi:hypothetical protein